MKKKSVKKAKKLIKKMSKIEKKVDKAVQKTPVGKAKIKKVMHEASVGKLHSGSKSGPLVTKKPQAIAIALSEAKKAVLKKKKRK